MTRPLRIQYPGAFYYISQHGNCGAFIFKSDSDRKTFLEILATSLTTYTVTLHGFVLMKNHFHLLVETPLGNLSEFMRHLNIRYTSYFNQTYRRKGHLYGGRYKSIIFEKKGYLNKISHYLHLNPVKVGVNKRKKLSVRIECLTSWKWSSLPGYIGTYPRYESVTYDTVLQPFGGDTPHGRAAYSFALQQQLQKSWLMKTRIVGQAAIGSTPFIEELRDRMKNPETPSREIPAVTKINCFVMQEKILAEMENCLKCSRQQMLFTPGDLRNLTMEMLYRYSGLSNPAIGSLMGLDYSSISLGRKKLQKKRSTAPLVDAKITLLEKRLNRLR